MKYCLMILLVFPAFQTFSQILQPAHWSYEVSGQPEAAGDEVELVFEVSLDKHWYVYSTDFVPAQDFGPLPTQFDFEPHPSYERVGAVKSVGSKEKTDDLLGLTFRYMDESPAVFKQRVKILSNNPVIKGTYEYQVCTMVDGKCIPGDGAFEFKVKIAD